jgi:hypothetical protein
MAEPLLVSKRDAALMLGVSPRTVSNLMRAKSLPCRRIGRRSLIPVASIKNFIRHDHPMSPAPHSRARAAETQGGEAR